MKLFKINNTSNSQKRVQLTRTSAADKLQASVNAGATFMDDKNVGCCLAPANITDVLHFSQFPRDSNNSLLFDIEIDGVFYNLMDGYIYNGSLYDANDQPLTELMSKIIIHFFEAAWNGAIFRNMTKAEIKIKIFPRWADASLYNDHLAIDGVNTTTVINADGTIEARLAPRLEWDEVPEENKFIAKVRYGRDMGIRAPYNTQELEYPEWTELYMYLNYGTIPTHESEYVCIDWGDGLPVRHYPLLSLDGSNGDIDSQEIGIYEPREPGEYTVKVWCSRPFEYFSLSNIFEVIQWGRYLFEESWSIGDRWSYDPPSNENPWQYEGLDKIPSKLDPMTTWVELNTYFSRPTEFFLKGMLAEHTCTSLEYSGWQDSFTQKLFRYYGNEINYIGYNHFKGKLGDCLLKYGAYPQDYPALGFADLDQILIHFPGKIAGTQMKVGLDLFSHDPDNMIGTFDTLKTSEYIKYYKDAVTEDHYFLLDFAKCKTTPEKMNDFLLAMRLWFDGDYYKSKMPIYITGWLDSNVDIINNALVNVPKTSQYHQQMVITMRDEQRYSQIAHCGEKVAFIHYDNHVSLFTPKDNLGTFNEASPFRTSDLNSLDVIFHYGYPGYVITLNSGETLTLGDSGFHKEVCNGFPTNSPVKDTFLPRPGYSYWDQAVAYKATLKFDYRATVNGTPISDWQNPTNGVVELPIPDNPSFYGGNVSVDHRQISELTGNEVIFGKREAYWEVKDLREDDYLVISIPKDFQYDRYTTWLAIEADVDYLLSYRFITPGEYKYVGPSMFPTTNGLSRTYTSYTAAPKPFRADGVADTQLVQFLLMTHPGGVIPKGTAKLISHIGTLVQRGTMFTPA